MQDARRRAVAVATGIQWLAIGAGLVAPFAVTGVARWVMFAVALAAAAVRARAERPAVAFIGSVGLVSVGAGVAGLSGGVRSLAFAAVVVLAADGGAQRGGAAGALLGAGGTLAVLGVGLSQPAPVMFEAVDVWVVLVTPMTGLAFGTIHRDLPITGSLALRATAQALDELIALSQRVQPGLDRWDVADAIVTGLRAAPTWIGLAQETVAGPHLFVGVDGVLHGVGSPWDRRPVGLLADLKRGPRLRTFVPVDRADLPAAIAGRLTEGRWLLHRFGDDADGAAVLVDERTHPLVLGRITETLGTAGLALASASRFETLQGIANDAARRRLAHDLHDGVAQSLTHARFELELLELRGDEVATEVRRARQAADAALLEVRRTIEQLRGQQSLVDALSTHVDTISAFARAEVVLRVTSTPDAVEVPDAHVGELLRVTQEAISNALRHSGASRVEVTLVRTADAVRVEVADDGSGIDDTVTAGVGLTTMRERARTVGGRLTIEPGDRGVGTVVALEVPVGSAGFPAAVAGAAARSGLHGGVRETQEPDEVRE